MNRRAAGNQSKRSGVPSWLSGFQEGDAIQYVEINTFARKAMSMGTEDRMSFMPRIAFWQCILARLRYSPVGRDVCKWSALIANMACRTKSYSNAICGARTAKPRRVVGQSGMKVSMVPVIQLCRSSRSATRSSWGWMERWWSSEIADAAAGVNIIARGSSTSSHSQGCLRR